MIIKPDDFENSGEVDCCVRAKGRLSIRAITLIEDPERFEAYCHTFTPGSRNSKDVVLKHGTLAEVVNYTNEKCGLQDTVGVNTFKVRCPSCGWQGTSSECEVIGDMRTLHCSRCHELVLPGWPGNVT